MESNETYFAPKPNDKKGYSRYLKYLPPFSLYYMLKGVCNYFFGRFVGNIVSDGQVLWPNDSKKFKQKNRFGLTPEDILKNYENTVSKNKDSFTFNKYQVNTYDKIKLSGVEILHKENPQNKKYLVVFAGRGVLFERDIDEYLGYAKKFNCNVVTYNYRGVYNSSGKATHYKQLKTDGISQVERLLSKGIKPENIILYGHSLGGCVATMTADYMHKNGKKVYLFNDRSFTSIPDFTAGSVGLSVEQKGFPLLGKFVTKVLSPILKGVISLCGWKMNVLPGYKRIPEQYRDYTLVRSSKEIRKKTPMLDDGVINYRATLHYALKPQRKRQKSYYLKNISYAKLYRGKNLSTEKADEIIKTNEQKLHQYRLLNRAHKMKGSPNPNYDSIFDILRRNEVQKIAHTLPLKNLQNRSYPIDGQEYLGRFIKRASQVKNVMNMEV